MGFRFRMLEGSQVSKFSFGSLVIAVTEIYSVHHVCLCVCDSKYTAVVTESQNTKIVQRRGPTTEKHTVLASCNLHQVADTKYKNKRSNHHNCIV